MNRYEILDFIFDLVSEQREYIAFYAEIRRSNDLLLELEQQNFNNTDDLIYYLENMSY